MNIAAHYGCAAWEGVFANGTTGFFASENSCMVAEGQMHTRETPLFPCACRSRTVRPLYKRVSQGFSPEVQLQMKVKEEKFVEHLHLFPSCFPFKFIAGQIVHSCEQWLHAAPGELLGNGRPLKFAEPVVWNGRPPPEGSEWMFESVGPGKDSMIITLRNDDGTRTAKLSSTWPHLRFNDVVAIPIGCLGTSDASFNTKCTLHVLKAIKPAVAQEVLHPDWYDRVVKIMPSKTWPHYVDPVRSSSTSIFKIIGLVFKPNHYQNADEATLANMGFRVGHVPTRAEVEEVMKQKTLAIMVASQHCYLIDFAARTVNDGEKEHDLEAFLNTKLLFQFGFFIGPPERSDNKKKKRKRNTE